jgi:hypothetical protein
MTASEPKRSTGDFSLTSAAGPYMTNSIRPILETSFCKIAGCNYRYINQLRGQSHFLVSFIKVSLFHK